MASATGIPESLENEPLLGNRGDVAQKQDDSIARNLIAVDRARLDENLVATALLLHPSSGQSPLTRQLQALVFLVPCAIQETQDRRPTSDQTDHSVLSQLLGTTGLLLQVQATLILQPTATPQQKLLGTRIHYGIQLVSVTSFLSAFVIIEINKGDHPHFISPHGILGLLTVIFIALQALVGVVQFFLPVTLLGSVEAGKRLYKYHRWSGYVLLLLEMATVVAATQTGYNLAAIHIPAGAVIVTVIAIVLGVGARIKKQKLGL
ncbi:Cytochrome b561 eukaryote [Penicillium hispanicum]|uniref:Cytochrome b561 eukaryote n=1 Tax=Penicillium hispanicum TaxID=1080232 RepID=UPI00254269E5|nr:Cytochrome b561 eukaryote [Penicillium hispanicum]KAJ5594786.1 Cytochrome b561 eukaryote [Penicillium hispanicum]